MFAFCFIFENKYALLARDSFGQKPLFYSLKNKDLITGSELIPILNMLKKDNLSINKFVIKQYLQFGASIAPNTFYNEISQVSPGEVISINLLDYKITKDKINLFKKILL
jgi:asparagine synthetase B (glutamine-hydrolysing)